MKNDDNDDPTITMTLPRRVTTSSNPTIGSSDHDHNDHTIQYMDQRSSFNSVSIFKIWSLK